MVIMQDAPPKLKRFLKPLGRKATVRALLIRCIVAFLLHRGRMGAAGAVRSEPRHRAQIARFLGRKMLRRLSPASVLRSQVLALESQKSGTLLVCGRSDADQPAGTEDREYVQQRQPPAPALQREARAAA